MSYQPPPERTAKFYPVTGEDQYPAIEVLGVMVFLYVEDGMIRVSLDLDTADTSLQHGTEQLVPLHITVQGSTVSHYEPRI